MADNQSLKDNESIIHPIDLPGEPVRLWLGHDHTILLRKHRDILLDFNVGDGANYAIQTPDDFFYNEKTQKRTKQAAFADGELFHARVSRDFNGPLILRSSKAKALKIYPNELDQQNYGSSPKEKSAPIILQRRRDSDGILRNSAQEDTLGRLSSNQNHADFQSIETPRKDSHPISTDQIDTTALSANNEQIAPGTTIDNMPSGKRIGSQYPIETKNVRRPQTVQTGHIVEILKTEGRDVPKQVLDFIASDDETAPLIPDTPITRQWILSQIAGGAAYTLDNNEWLSELWKQRFTLTSIEHASGTKWYISFTGNARTRSLITGTRYGAENSKILQIAAGAGSFKGGASAAWESASGAFKGWGATLLVFTIAMDVAVWYHDYQEKGENGKPKKDLADLFSLVGIDLLKAGISAALATTFVAGGLSLAGLLLGTISAPVILLVGATVVAGALIGVGLDLIDKELGVTDHVADWLRSSANYLEKEFSSDYDWFTNLEFPWEKE